MTNHEILCKTLIDESNKFVAQAKREAVRFQNFKKLWMLENIETYRQKAFTVWTIVCGLYAHDYTEPLKEVVEITADAESDIAEIYNEMSALAEKFKKEKVGA